MQASKVNFKFKEYTIDNFLALGQSKNTIKWKKKIKRRFAFVNANFSGRIRTQNDWHSVCYKNLKNETYYIVKKYYITNIFLCIQDLFPENSFTAWKFNRVPKEFWNTMSHQIDFMEYMSKELKINRFEDWYTIPSGKLSYLVQPKYYATKFDLLQTIYPDYLWLPWKFNHIPKFYWKNLKNQRFFFEYEIQKNLNIKTIKDWYKINTNSVLKSSSNIIKQHNSILDLLNTIFPEIEWYPWLLNRVPRDYWKDLFNQKFFFKILKNEFKIENMEDWYKIGVRKLWKISGALYYQHNSLTNLLQTIYPEKEWFPWKFKTVANNFWNLKLNRRYFLTESLIESYKNKNKNNIKNHNIEISKNFENNDTEIQNFQNSTKNFENNDTEIQNFENVNLDFFYFQYYEEIAINSNSRILSKYKNIYDCVLDIFPEKTWVPWYFQRIPSNFWKKKENIFEYLNYLKSKYNIKEYKDWYNIGSNQIINDGGGSLLKIQGGLPNLLQKTYPGYNWDTKKLKSNFQSRKNQFIVFKKISNIFQNQIVKLDFYHPLLNFENSWKQLELDIFLPNLNLAFEYQGQQHYETTTFHGNPEEQIKRDQIKQKICKNNGITLIPIPYWWDGQKSFLFDLIKTKRPDILPKVNDVINCK